MTRAPDTVGEIMTRDVITVSPADTVERAVRLMVEHEIGSVVVVDGDRPVGVFTERDLTRRILEDTELLQRKIEDVMSAPVVVTRPDVQMIEAFDLMNARNIRRLPIVEDERIVGIVTERDLLKWVGAVAAE
jgi:CBS domain-containing protein